MDTPIAPGQPRLLQAGPVRMKFQDGELRYLYIGQREIVRRIYFAVRDERFETPMPVFGHMTLTERPGGFLIRQAARCRNQRADYSWTGVIEGRPDGTIIFSIEGSANADFPSPRIGVNMLLGTTLGGIDFTRISADGSRVDPFPREIALRNWDHGRRFTALKYSGPDGLGISAELDGGYAGIEDQRNYGDSSYKVYTFMPYAYPKVPAGRVMTQKLTLTVHGAAAGAVQDAPCRVRIGAPGTRRLPRVTRMDMPSHVEGYGFHVVNDPQKFSGQAEVAWPYNPIVHLNDDDMIMENPPAAADQARLIRQWSPQAVIRVAPIFIRFPGESSLDERCSRQIAAAFSASLIGHLAAGGADEAAFAFSQGPAGAVIERMAALAGRSLREVEVTGPLPQPVESLAVEDGPRVLLWVINRTATEQAVVIDPAPASQPTPLRPYEVREITL